MWKTFTSALLVAGLAACGANPERTEMSGGDAPGRAVSVSPDVSPEVERQYQDALALIRDSNRQAARELLLRITREQPRLSGPWTNLGRIYLQDGDHDAARNAFEQAVAANPGNCAARSEYGVMLRKLGEFEAALGQYQACLSELYLGRLGDALAAYRHYLELVPEPDKKVQGWVTDLERRAKS